MCRVVKKNENFNRTLAPFALTFGPNSIGKKMAEAPLITPVEAQSFSQISTGTIVGKHFDF